MASRNRTLEFVRHRDRIRTFRSQLGEEYASGGAGSSKLGRLKSLGARKKNGYRPLLEDADEQRELTLADETPRWAARAQDVQETLNLIKQRLPELRKQQGQRLLPRFEGPSEAELEAIIDRDSRAVTQLFSRAQQALQMIRPDPAAPTPTDAPLRPEEREAKRQAQQEQLVVTQNVQKALAAQLQELSVQFRREQSDYAAKLRAQATSAQTGSLLAGLESDNQRIDDDDLLDGGGPEGLAGQREMERRVRERSAEIAKVAQSIAELAEITKDISTLVIDQGTLLDQIDHNMERTEKNITSANEELRKAEEYQKGGRFIVCVVFLSVLIVCLFVILLARR
eukprot:tig00001187_g7458.t1